MLLFYQRFAPNGAAFPNNIKLEHLGIYQVADGRSMIKLPWNLK